MDAATERVARALEAFEAGLAGITREDLEAEQERLAAAKARFEAVRAPEPRLAVVTDENGVRWRRMAFPSGEVRYDFLD